MSWSWHGGRAATVEPQSARSGRHCIRALIDQATSDSVDQSDEHAGLLSTICDQVVCPFGARLGGESVECVRFERPRNGYGVNAICKSHGKTLVVDVGKLEWVDPLPKGHEWIEAYFTWRDYLA
jgi:hypothetical protein